jgi:hypothetical protein
MSRGPQSLTLRYGRVKLCATSRGSESGVALVITLILLSVITFMAIAFLVLSRGQKSSVTTTTDQTIARQAAEAAQARAMAEMLAPILASTNSFNYSMLVSTNYISPIGFTPGNSSPTNVNYAGRNGAFLTGRDALQNIANLEFNPRAPVFITNRLSGSNDFRYYLDLNRNGLFEPSGWVGATNTLGQPVLGTNQTPLLTYQMGDPQWIGQLEFPDHTHAADNRFISRYAFMVVPISQTLDINYIHNQASNPNKATFDQFGRDYLRNQGVGTWEMNLASFLYDLNTNIYAWGGLYTYQPPTAQNPVGAPIAGNAFVDAFAILKNRYANSPLSLAPVANLFANGTRAFSSDYIDGYSAGPIMTAVWKPSPDPDNVRTTRPWPGADNTNHFFSSQDLFDVTKTSAHFTNALLTAGSKTNTYDRYTFYRLLSQLGTDSAPERANKINLNYDNLVQKNALGVSSATNFFPWQPADFFTNVANALLANAGYNFSITNIPVYPTNYYTPSVHRLLQLAVNIYDASTNRIFGAANGYPYCPTVFRPLFRRISYGGTNTVITIAGFREVLGMGFASSLTAPAMIELDSGIPGVHAQRIPLLGVPFRADQLEPMVSGMPLIIGAKKGLPNFNEFSLQTYMYITRLLEFQRAVADGPVIRTNQMYIMALTNSFGLEAWNSYSNNWPTTRPLTLVAAADMTAIITNELGRVILSNRITRAVSTNIGSWSGWQNITRTLQSFVLPFGATNYSMFASNSTIANQRADFTGRWISPQTQIFDQSGFFYAPVWYLNLNTRLRFVLVDTLAQRVVDYVNINKWEPMLDLTSLLTQGAQCFGGDLANAAEQWCTNRPHGSLDPRVPTMGVLNQINVGIGLADQIPEYMSFSPDPFSGQDQKKAEQFFQYNLLGQATSGQTFVKSNVFYAPFNPYRSIFIQTPLQANDPLVHYTVGDLVDSTVSQTNVTFQSLSTWNDLGQVNHRYEPWSTTGSRPFGTTATMGNQLAAKDPLVTRPDDWDFPTNKFPNIGWLGRVHRGTPWQTVYLKSPNILLQPGASLKQNVLNWNKWTGNQQLWAQVTNRFGNQIVTNWVPVPLSLSLRYAGTTNFVDSLYSVPTNDWRILDLFTTAINDNATRGQLSVNQTNLAAWSAVLGGVNVLPDLFTNSTFIAPAGVYDPANPPGLARIVQGIINSRTNFPNNTYQRMGDILATPQLTVGSPYLSTRTNLMNDAVVERIPQQILGLLRTGDQPRFVIYSYGQSLKPAPRSVVPNSLFGNQFVGLCTNYQITAEVATRAVVRIDGAPTNTHAVIESFNVLPPD